VCCIVLQCVAVCCNVLQCVAVCCSVLQYVVLTYACSLPLKSANTTQNSFCRCVAVCVAVCCGVLQRNAVCCSMLQCVAVCRSALQFVLQCDAVRCSVIRCDVLCCRVLLLTLQRALQEVRERAREQQRERERTMAKILSENHSLKALVSILEEHAETLTFGIKQEGGKNQTLVHELERERLGRLRLREEEEEERRHMRSFVTSQQTEAQQVLQHTATEAQQLLCLNHELRIEIMAMSAASEASAVCMLELEEAVKETGYVVETALGKARCMHDAWQSGAEMRQRAQRLAVDIFKPSALYDFTESLNLVWGGYD